jgi:hypothetical protein
VPNRRRAARASALAAVLLAGGVFSGALSACVFPGDEPAPGSPTNPDEYSTNGFPPPGPPPQPGVITPDPVAPVAPSEAPRPAEGPVPTEGPVSPSPTEPEPTGNPAPPPGS